MRDWVESNRSTLALSLVGAAFIGLIAGYALKAPCRDGRWTGQQYRKLCYSDIVPLYFARGLAEGGFPYLSADLEYPAGTGLYVGVTAKTVSTVEGFFNANAIGLALMGVGTAFALTAMALHPRRVLLYAVGPALVLYAFHNWDLLAVGLTTLALYAFWRGADPWAGFLLGVGAATKLYPAFVLPALALAAWRRDERPPWRLGLAFALGFGVLNVPLMIANLDGWKYPWVFQSERGPNFETSWFMIQRHFRTASPFWNTGYATFVNYLSGAVFVIGTGVLMGREARRDRIRPYALSFGILVLFLLTAKVFSPQYALWILPFFALLRLPWWSYVLFAITDAAVWIAVSAYFLAELGSGDPTLRLNIVEGTVWARYLVLGVLLWLSRRADELVRDPAGEPVEAAPVPLSA